MPHRPRFRTGERIPYSGIYRVSHAGHRLPHEVTLIDGEIFPRCLQCDYAVEFELLQTAPDLRNESDFRVVLFGLPTTDENLEESSASANAGPATEKEDVQDQTARTESTSEQLPVAAELPVNQSAVSNGDVLALIHAENKNPRKFKPGDLVPEHGIYRVEHDSHRLLHQVTLAKDARFPRCRTCSSEVRFRLLRVGKPGPVMAPFSSSILEDVDGPNLPLTG